MKCRQNKRRATAYIAAVDLIVLRILDDLFDLRDSPIDLRRWSTDEYRVLRKRLLSSAHFGLRADLDRESFFLANDPT